jgi:hypothetical protein
VTGPTSVEGMVAFLGYSVLSKSSYLFNDTMSEINTLPTDKNDFCGDKEYLFILDGQITD